LYSFLHINKYTQRYKIYLHISIIDDIYGYINIKTYIKMGCGCKQKANQSQPVQQSGQSQPQAPSQAPQPKTAPIQESIRKVVEKYYNKK
jgi:hypothetical protein